MRKGLLKRILVVGFIIIVVLVVLILAYLFIFQRVFGNPFKPGGDYEGIEYYESGAYLEFEKGGLLVESFSSYDFAELCEIKDFYYRDNCTQDSIIYGIYPDVYALTLDAGDNYDAIKAEIQENGSHAGEVFLDKNHEITDRADCYIMPSMSDTSTDWFLFFVGQDCEFLRLVLLTDYVYKEPTNPLDTAYCISSMDWTIE